VIRRLTDSKLAEQPGQPVVVGNLFDPRLNAGGSSGRSAARIGPCAAGWSATFTSQNARGGSDAGQS
jgi:hypothetical protein